MIVNENNASDFNSKFKELPKDKLDYNFNNGFLTHRLISIDHQYGVSTSDVDKKAIANVNRFLSDVSNKCEFINSHDGISKYVSCANDKLGDNFYYTQSVDVSNNYAIHRSDCDTNTYLMMDALSLKGIKSFIVYAPGHAFLAWADNEGFLSFQETTEKNNHGSPADLKKSFYRKNFDRSYYTPFNEDIATSVYKALISGEAKGKVDISKLYEHYKWNSFISDWYFDFKNDHGKITFDDVKVMANSLKLDITSNDKYLDIVNYFINNNKIELAKYFYAKVDYDSCSDDCFYMGVKLHLKPYVITKRLFDHYNSIMKSNNLQASEKYFFISLLIYIVATVLLLSYLTRCVFWVIKHRKKKSY